MNILYQQFMDFNWFMFFLGWVGMNIALFIRFKLYSYSNKKLAIILIGLNALFLILVFIRQVEK